VSKNTKRFIREKVLGELNLDSYVRDTLEEDIRFSDRRAGSKRRRKGKEESIEDGIIEGEKFTVKGVTFQSMPSKTGATRAMQLYDACAGCGDQTDGPDGRDLIGKIIYDKVKPGSSAKYAPRLGTKSESYWSSWFFGAAYKEDTAYHKVWLNNGVGYPAIRAYQIRQKVFSNPDNYKSTPFYMLFHIKEAPLFPGDSIFKWRAESVGKTFSQIGGGGPSHMKIMGTDGNFYGGNEGHSAGKPGARKDRTKGNTVGKSSFKLDGQRRLVPAGGYMAVVKKVIIAPTAPTSKTPLPDDEKVDEQRKHATSEARKRVDSESQLYELIKKLS
jgi:hypothetical protein